MSQATAEIVATALEPFTEADFVEGRVESIVTDGAPIYMTWPHGDETLGPRTAYHLYSGRQDLAPYVDYFCGNPQAASQNPPTRCIEADLNRAYHPDADQNTYEYGRAQRTLDMVEHGAYRYILDMHTTAVDQQDCIIVDEDNFGTKPVQEILAASPSRHIVVFPHEIAVQGLIGNVPGSVSVEYNHKLADEVGVNHMATTIEGLVRGEPLHDPFEREVFFVDRTILKGEDRDPGDDAKNFEFCEAEGYYPVLLGENSYRRDPSKNYIGFRAPVRRLILM